MPRYAAFLRGINVGGHRVKSADLCSHLEAIGFSEVRAFRASGNLVVDAGRGSEARLVARIERGLEEALGYGVATFLRTAEELWTIARAEPFPAKQLEASRGKLQVALLSGRPPKRVRDRVLGLATDRDRLAFGARELFWLPSGGTQESELDMRAIDAALGSNTMRTKGTLDQMAAKFFDG